MYLGRHKLRFNMALSRGSRQRHIRLSMRRPLIQQSPFAKAGHIKLVHQVDFKVSTTTSLMWRPTACRVSKTIQSVTACTLLRDKVPGAFNLVVTTRSSALQWADEIASYFKPVSFLVSVLCLPPPTDLGIWANLTTLTIRNADRVFWLRAMASGPTLMP